MKKTITTFILILFIGGLLSIIVFGSRQKQQSRNISPLIFYYGTTCPHCEDVEKWMKDNDIETKIKIVKKEVYENQENATELSRTAQSCGLPTNNIGVPFLYAEGECLVGTPDIISYLAEKTNE